MDQPQIQYVQTEDGVSIAYYAIGQGPATLYLLMPQSHLEVDLTVGGRRQGRCVDGRNANHVPRALDARRELRHEQGLVGVAPLK